MPLSIKDERYTVNKEFTGAYHKTPVKDLKQGQTFAARFCGSWIGCAKTEAKAWILCIIYDDLRTINIL